MSINAVRIGPGSLVVRSYIFFERDYGISMEVSHDG